MFPKPINYITGICGSRHLPHLSSSSRNPHAGAGSSLRRGLDSRDQAWRVPHLAAGTAASCDISNSGMAFRGAKSRSRSERSQSRAL